jgi:two-component system, NarL family, response regulator LiaR
MNTETGPETALTKREKEVVDYLHKGLLYKEIAIQMKVGIDTVKKHIKNIYKKLEARNRTEAVNKYYRA